MLELEFKNVNVLKVHLDHEFAMTQILEHDVLGLQIAVKNAFLMRGPKRSSDLFDDLRTVFEVHSFGPYLRAQVHSIEFVTQDDDGKAALYLKFGADIVSLRDEEAQIAWQQIRQYADKLEPAEPTTRK